MIDELVKIHDNFTIEMKTGFMGKAGVEKNRFNLNTWFFVPGSLDINRSTYTKESFYRDIKSNIRLITPIFPLKEIAEGLQSPLISIQNSIKNLFLKGDEASLRELEYQFKMFNSILKSALREDVRAITKLSDDKQIDKGINEYIDLLKTISNRFRGIEMELTVIQRFSKAIDFFLFGDEFMSLLVEIHSFKLLKYIESREGQLREKNAPKILDLIKQELAYKKSKGYLIVEEKSLDHNRSVILRRGILKKYSESELFVNTIKKEDGFLVRQFVYSLAAGLSMIFATIVAFSFQLKYGNFTLPFFVAIVVGYMLKDIIKELSRFYFAHKLSNKYFDLKTVISIGKDKIGLCKESFDFISNERIPATVLKVRNRSSLLEANNKFTEEQIILYRMQVETDNKLINKHTEYRVEGINNIIRFNIASLTHKMDNPEVPLFKLDEHDNFIFVGGEKVYFINMVLQLQHEEQIEFRHYRIVFNRDGIKEVKRM